MKDQQEAERKKQASQEIQQALEAQTKVIAEKQESVRNDLAQVEPAVIDAQQGNQHFIARDVHGNGNTNMPKMGMVWEEYT